MVRDCCAGRDVLARVRPALVGRVVDRSLQQAHRDLGPIRQLARQLEGAGQELLVRDDLAHQPQLVGFRRRDDALAHQEVEGAAHAQVLDQQRVAPLVRQQAEPQGRAA